MRSSGSPDRLRGSIFVDNHLNSLALADGCLVASSSAVVGALASVVVGACELGVEKGIRAAATERRDMIDFGEVEQSFRIQVAMGIVGGVGNEPAGLGARVVVEAVERPDAVALQLAELPGSDVVDARKSERAAVDLEEEIRQLGVGVVAEEISPKRGLVVDEAVVLPRQGSSACCCILTRRASERNARDPSLALRVGI